MDQTTEENDLLAELKSIYGTKPLFFLKFTQEEAFAKDIINGKLYANTAEYFRNLEISSGIRGQGDKFELLSTIAGHDGQITSCSDNTPFLPLEKATVTIYYKSDDVLPIVSFMGFTIDDLVYMSSNESEAIFTFPFTDEQYNNMSLNFGEYCVIIEGVQFSDAIETYSLKNNIAYIFDKVIYCPQNFINRIQSFIAQSTDRFLYKNEDLSYQKEYRLVYDMKIPDDHFINLGEINCNYLKSSELKDLGIHIRLRNPYYIIVHKKLPHS